MNNLPQCSNLKILTLIESSLDRLTEASWFIHMMEENYHKADQFRWCLNAFLKSLKEIDRILVMELQNNKEISQWLKKEIQHLLENELISTLHKHRDLVVHKSMLLPASKGTVGFTRGKGLKLGLSTPINQMEDSEMAILRYIKFAAKNSDFLGILYMEEDGGGEYTCVQREWRLTSFPDTELTQLCADAWKLVAELVFNTAEKLGANIIKPLIELGDPNQVQFEIYAPDWIKKQFSLAKTVGEN